MKSLASSGQGGYSHDMTNQQHRLLFCVLVGLSFFCVGLAIVAHINGYRDLRFIAEIASLVSLSVMITHWLYARWK